MATAKKATTKAATKRTSSTESEPAAAPAKLGTQGPASGPYPGDVEVVAQAPAPVGGAPLDEDGDEDTQSASERKGTKSLESEKKSRTVRVVARTRGYTGNRLIEEGTTFDLTLAEGEQAPRWVKPVDGDTPPTPRVHSTEARMAPPHTRLTAEGRPTR